MSPETLADLGEIQRRLALLFTEGVPDRGLFVRELAAKTVFTALFVGAVGDPDDPDAALIRPSTVCWMSDGAAMRTDASFRGAWHRAAMRGRAAVERLLDKHGLPRGTWIEQARLRARAALLVTDEPVVTMPGRGDRRLPPGESSALTKAAIELLAARLMGEPYVLAIAHGGDPTSDQDRTELSRYGLDLADSPALPDVILVDAEPGRVWFVEVVVTGGEIDESRKAALLAWAGSHGVPADRCRFLTVFRSRSDQVFRRSVSTLARDSLVWVADEPDGLLRLDTLPPPSR